jgi:hypothetical protein
MAERQDSRNILIITQRDTFERDAALMASLLEALHDTNHRIIFFKRPSYNIAKILDPHNTHHRLPWWIRKPLKVMRLLAHPSKWNYFFFWYRNKDKRIREECEALEQLIKDVGNNKRVTILARSGGGRIASLIADKAGVSKIVCLGYPFKNPKHGLEPKRYEHLAHLKTPLLILQGTRDEYGGAEVKDMYPLSKSISVAFYNTDHDFNMPQKEWDRVVASIKAFILWENEKC